MDYRMKALEAYQKEQQELAEQNAKDLETRYKNGTDYLIEKLIDVLSVDSGVTFPPIKSVNDTIYAILDGLPNLRFYLYHWADYHVPELTVEPIPPDYKVYSWPASKHVRNWADVGEMIQKLEAPETIPTVKPEEKPIPEFESYYAFWGDSKELARILNSNEQIDLVETLKYETDETFGIYLLHKW